MPQSTQTLASNRRRKMGCRPAKLTKPSSSSWCATGTDFLDPLPPLVPIFHRFRLVLHATSRAVVDRFLPVTQTLLVRVRGSTGIHPL